MAKAQEISENNSTELALQAGEVFTGVADDVSRLATINIFLESDRDGELEIQVSTNQEDWTTINSIDFNSEDCYLVHKQDVLTRWFRLVYRNNSSNQTYFRMTSIFHLYKSSPEEPVAAISKVDLQSLDALNGINCAIASMAEQQEKTNNLLKLILS